MRPPITKKEEAAIRRALEAKPYAAAVARESNGAWSYAQVKRVAHQAKTELTAGRHWHRLPLEEEAAIKAALEVKPHASAVARESEGTWSYATVQRVAQRTETELTAGREAQGYKRLTEERRAAVITARRANPNGRQEDIARASGVSRATVSRIETGDCRRGGVMPCEP